MSPRSPFFKLEPKNPLPVRARRESGDVGPLPYGDPTEQPAEKSPIDVARDGYQVISRDGARRAYEGARYDPDDPPHFGRFTS